MKVELIDTMGTDLSVINAARVSFHKFHDEFQDGDTKLISYLAKHGHWTPFAHAFLSFRIKAPIFVARQLVKHQVGLAWNEVSRRYVDDEPEFFAPLSWRKRPDGSVKQGSGDIYTGEEPWGVFIEIPVGFKDYVNIGLDLYLDMLNKGIAPEQARMVLPQNTMTEWIWSGSLAAFARVCRLRLDPHAQQETQEIAKLINGLVPETFKHSWKALLDDNKQQ
jgi:thymidylate synthase (FAD)